ncbi:MAG: LysM peptidoglycan-binding domain-containing protein [Acetobacteraceae bacterium]|jgi:nucleoid-associated protein YgaU|nr:LysM peptidoglycan-binding domain-containing protein [Acetobacteraceae bacterium]
MRLILLGLAGLAVLAAAVWLAQDEATPPAPPVASLPQAPAAPQAAAPPAPAGTPAPVAPAPVAAPLPPPPAPLVRPSFDVVRIGARGDAVMAGRAAPGAEVIILDGEAEIGRARADGRGEWVFVSSAPLRPGGRELTLRARNPDGTETDAPSTVVLIVPEPERDVAGQPAQGAAAAPLALLTPREGQEGELRVLQAPAPRPEPTPQPAAVPPPAAPPAPAPAAPREAAMPAPASPPAAPPPSTPPPPPAPVAQAERPAPALPSGRPQGGVSVDAVDYAETGEVRFAGRAGPGGSVRLYLDNRHIGDAAPDTEGRWNLRPEVPISPGLFELRADQVDGQGRVTARVQMPFQRSEAPPEALREGSIIVQPGQNLWRIARQTYGRGVHFTVIYAANREAIRDPNMIFPGQVFSLPAEVPAHSPRR